MNTFTIEIPSNLADEANIYDDQRSAFINALCRLMYKDIDPMQPTFVNNFNKLVEATKKHNEVKERISNEVILPAVEEKYGTRNIEVAWSFMYTDRIATVSRLNENVSVETESDYPIGECTLLTPVDNEHMTELTYMSNSVDVVEVFSIKSVEAAKKLESITIIRTIYDELIGEFPDKYPNTDSDSYSKMIDIYANINAEYNSCSNIITEVANGYIKGYMDSTVPMKWTLDFNTLTLHLTRIIK